jgi:hypothetical protein
MILFRRKCRVTINNGQSRRCRSTTKMSIQSRRSIKQVTSLNNGFFHLRLVKFLHRACTELLAGSLAYPTVARLFFFSIEAVQHIESERGRAYVSPYRENAKKRPSVMMSDTMLRGRSEYIAARRSRSATPTFGELITTIGWPATLR